MFLKIALLVISLHLSVQCAMAQFPGSKNLPGTFGTDDQRKNNGINPLVDQNAENTNQSDTTTKKKKPRKPLESFFFDDSLRQTRIFAWTVNPAYNTIQRQVVDTLMDSFQIDYDFQRPDVGAAMLGNIGGAVIPLNYFRRPVWQNFSFVKVWDDYIMTPEKTLFYNAKVPYSRLSYEMSGQTKIEEQLFNFVISQNVSPSTSVNLVYNADGTRGMYMNQRTLDRYFTLNVAHTGKRYAIHGGYIYNHGEINENGGIRDDREITDTILSSADMVNVKLKNAKNVYRGHTFWYTQSYGIPLRKQRDDELTIQKIPTIYIGQSLDYTIFNRTYKAENDTALYKQHYQDEVFTADSMSQSLLDINVFAQLQPYNRDGALGLVSGGIGTEFASYYYNDVPETYYGSFGRGGKTTKNSTYVYGSLEGKISKYVAWDASVKYYLFGYKTQDLSAKGNISLSAYVKKQPITLDAGIEYRLTAPDFWEQSYFSNHYAWSNSFGKTSSMLINAKLSVPSIKLYLGANYEMSTGKVFYNKDALPEQFSGPVSVLGLYLQKDFRAGGFHFNHRVLAQFSSNQVVAPVPMLSAFLSYYFEFNIVKNVLRLQTGVDGHYNTEYFAFGYDPALGQFYNQREKKLGGYPYLDAFVNAKWKRFRLLLKLQHFNANLFGERNYFQVLHHPQNRMMFKIGVSWSFYD